MEESRISAIKRDIDKMYVILPFENFTKTNTTFLLRSLDIRSSMLFKISLQSMPLLLKRKSVGSKNAILPGSRKQEITKMLSVMLSVVNDFPAYHL
jgi:lipid-A-disaccharide synthase